MYAERFMQIASGIIASDFSHISNSGARMVQSRVNSGSRLKSKRDPLEKVLTGSSVYIQVDDFC